MVFNYNFLRAFLHPGFNINFLEHSLFSEAQALNKSSASMEPKGLLWSLQESIFSLRPE
jgi:hypothetical protein